MSEDLAADVAAIGSMRIIPSILDTVCRVTGMRFAAVARVTEDRWIACVIRDELAFGLAPGGELPIESTLCREVRTTAQPVVTDDVASDAVYCHHHTPATYGFRSYLSVPIRREDGSIFGTLCALDPEPRRLRAPETVGIFEMFAEVIGQHIAALDRMRASQARLFDERRVAALREELVAMLGHDLRDPFVAMEDMVRLLRGTTIDDQAQRLVGLMEASLGRMRGVIDDLADFTQFRLGGEPQLHRERIDADELLEKITLRLRSRWPERVIETAMRLDGPIVCDRQRLGQIAFHLLSNALAYGTADRPVRLAAWAEGGWFELSVANAGPPIPAEIMANLFQPFARALQ